MMRLPDLVPGEFGCLRVAFDSNQPVSCGLLWQHDGPCAPFVPGDYLPPPLLHPLNVWLLLSAWRCPVCTEKFNYSPGAELVTAFRGVSENWDRAVPEWQWEFQPCGCVGRVVPGGHDEAPAGVGA